MKEADSLGLVKKKEENNEVRKDANEATAADDTKTLKSSEPAPAETDAQQPNTVH